MNSDTLVPACVRGGTNAVGNRARLSKALVVNRGQTPSSSPGKQTRNNAQLKRVLSNFQKPPS